MNTSSLLKKNNDSAEQENDDFDASHTMKNRLKDPILGTYVFSFFIYNWKIPLYLLSKIDVITKIELIEKALFREIRFPNSLDDIADLLWTLVSSPFITPIFTTVIILLVAPRCLRRMYKKIQFNKVRQANDEIDENQNLTPLKQKMERIQADHEKERQHSRNTYDKLQGQYNDLQIQISIKDQEIGKIKGEAAHLQESTNALELKKRTLEDALSAETQKAKELPILRDLNAEIQRKLDDLQTKQNDKNESEEKSTALASLNLSSKLLLPPREYGKIEQIDSEDVSALDEDAIKVIVRHIKDANSQNSSIQTLSKALILSIVAHDFTLAIRDINSMLELPLLDENEKTLLRIARGMIRDLQIYIE